MWLRHGCKEKASRLVTVVSGRWVGVKKTVYVLWQGKGASRCVVAGGGQVQPSWSVKSATTVGRVGLRTICYLLGCRFGDKAARRQITVLPYGFSHHAAHGLGRRPSGLSVPYLNEMLLKCATGNRCEQMSSAAEARERLVGKVWRLPTIAVQGNRREVEI